MKIATALLAITLLAGCTSTDTSTDTETERTLLRLSLRIATAQVIDRYAGISPDAIISITSGIREHVDLDGAVDIEGAREVLRDVRQVYGLSATEMVALDEIITVARSRLEDSRVTDVTARVGDYLDWVESAAVAASRR